MVRTVGLLATGVCLALSFTSPALAQGKPRVAVLDFDYDGVRSSAASALGTNQDVGAGVAEVLVQELLAGGRFVVLERTAIDAVLKEQNFANSDRADPATAARIGRILGVQAIVLGSITEFNVQETSGGTGSVGRFTRGIVDAVQRNNTKAVVGINARLVDATTGVIITAKAGRGESGGARMSVSTAASGSAVDMTSSSFSGSAIGIALATAARDVAAPFNEAGATLGAARTDYAGVIADVSGKTVVLNVGRKAGVQVGDRVDIVRVVRTIPDPQDKTRILRSITETVASALVTEVDDVSATATVDGSAAVKVGDAIKRGA
jgi:curli biogenesis system outer membrane secretion channel CsgG